MCNYYIASSAVRYHVWSVAYSTLFGWCHTGTKTEITGYTRLQAEDIPTDGSVLSLIIGLQCGKNEPVYYSSVNAGLISSLETRFCLRKWGTIITWRQPSWTQDISWDWLTIQSWKAMLITGQIKDLDISQPGDCANIPISVDRCSICRPACWL